MKKRYRMLTALLFVLMVSMVCDAGAYSRSLGLGVILGEPTGLSLKSWISRTTAIDAAAAWSFGQEDSFHFHADFLVHDFSLLKTKQGRLPVYYGIGGRIKLEDKARVGIRIPVGISYLFDRTPLDIFFELGPVLDLVPRTEVTLSGALGIRFYFQ